MAYFASKRRYSPRSLWSCESSSTSSECHGVSKIIWRNSDVARTVWMGIHGCKAAPTKHMQESSPSLPTHQAKKWLRSIFYGCWGHVGGHTRKQSVFFWSNNTFQSHLSADLHTFCASIIPDRLFTTRSLRIDCLRSSHGTSTWRLDDIMGFTEIMSPRRLHVF